MFTTEPRNRTTEWLREKLFNGPNEGKRWAMYAQSCYLNPAFPDNVEHLNRAFSLLIALVNKCTAIDRLHITDIKDCSSFAEAIEYLICFSRALPSRGRTKDTIEGWEEYMLYIAKQAHFAPDFTQWDKHTRQLEGLAKDVLAESMRVLEEHNPAEKRLPSVIVDGIYARIWPLQFWFKTHLKVVRAQEDYKKWKIQNDVTLQPWQIRRRRGHHADGAVTMISTTTALTPFEMPTPKHHQEASKFQVIGEYLKEDLTIWSINLAIYISCTILQAISFANHTPSELSASDYLNAIQTTLTQLLSVLMTYILAIRSASDHHFGKRYQLWFVLAGTLPNVALIIFKWYAGMSALLTFLGTAMTGILQVLLAVDMKRSKALP